ncbi:MAG: hypothetical protein IAE80_12675 [Anaerolinea sp.]|nr:hypothetical protein [Anaerolinea sp.]
MSVVISTFRRRKELERCLDSFTMKSPSGFGLPPYEWDHVIDKAIHGELVERAQIPFVDLG